MIVETIEGKESGLRDAVRACFPANGKDFITAVDENSVVIVKEIVGNDSKADIEKTASMIKDHLEKEGISRVHVAYGNIVNELKEVSRSY